MNEAQKIAWLKARNRLKTQRTAAELFDGIRAGDRTSLSMGITLLESQKQSDIQEASTLIQMCLPFSGNSIRIGITGVPGVGKSSFIEAFGQTIANADQPLAVLAIDPSSERTGGSILGDKTRMHELSVHPNVFIRPSASGNSLGGVARRTREAILLCEAAGYRIIFIETVGVGQSETYVHSMVDCFLLLLLAGAGDELQGIKRGIMEMADILAVTKADGENTRKAQLASRELKNAIHLFPPTESGWIPKVMTCSSMEKTGLSEMWENIQQFASHAQLKGYFQQRRQQQEVNWFQSTLRELILSGLYSNPELMKELTALEKEVTLGKISAFSAAENIYQAYLKHIDAARNI